MPPVGSEAGHLASVPDADDDLAGLESSCWRWLTAAVGDRESPLRTPVFATAGAGAAGVEARSVILRAVEATPRQLVCYSDVRACKVAAIAYDPRVAWVFYDALQRVQLRLRALARVHHGDDVTEHHWKQLPLSAHGDYLGIAAPGGAVEHVALSARTAATAGGDLQAQRNFAVIRTQVQSLDLLFLRRHGHRRAGFEYDADGGLICALELQP